MKIFGIILIILGLPLFLPTILYIFDTVYWIYTNHHFLNGYWLDALHVGAALICGVFGFFTSFVGALFTFKKKENT